MYSGKPQLGSAVCHSEAFTPLFSEWIMVHTEGISKINAIFLFPPGWHPFSLLFIIY